MPERRYSAQHVINEVEKAVVGKRDVLTKIMTAILAGGHIENHKGFCVHFATAATLMYRYCGYTARYVEGYVVPASAFHENEVGQYEAQITGEMGHAWCQVYDEETGEWTDMEHTPPAPENVTGQPPAATAVPEEKRRGRNTGNVRGCHKDSGISGDRADGAFQRRADRTAV